MRALIEGRVQGVYFRASTAREAVALGLSGTAVNLPDGRVEVIAQGTEKNLAALLEWLRHGPPLARVDHVDWDMLEPEANVDDSFTTG